MSLTAKQNQRMFSVLLQLAGIASVALLLCVYYFAVYRPLQNKRINHIAHAKLLESLMLHSSEEAEKHHHLRDKLASLQASISEVQHQLASSLPPVDSFKLLNNIASRVNLEIADYEIGRTETFPSHSQTTLDFNCRGSYDSICRFLEQAEQLTKATKLSRFELRPSVNSKRYQIQLTFVLYSEGESHDTEEGGGVS